MKKSLLPVVLLFAVALSLSPICLRAQNAKTTNTSPAQATLALDVRAMNTDQDIKKIKDVLSSAPGKILSYTIDKDTKKVTVVISPALQVIDLLELMKMAGYDAAYVNENNEYVKLGANGELTKEPYLAK